MTIYKNRGNKAGKLLKTKEVSIKTHPKRADLEFQTHVSNNCFKRLFEFSAHRICSRSGMLREWFDEEPNLGALQGATRHKNRGNEAKECLKTKDLTFLDAANRALFACP